MAGKGTHSKQVSSYQENLWPGATTVLAEYDEKLELRRQKLAFGQELLDIINAGSTLQVRYGGSVLEHHHI